LNLDEAIYPLRACLQCGQPMRPFRRPNGKLEGLRSFQTRLPICKPPRPCSKRSLQVGGWRYMKRRFGIELSPGEAEGL